jgi:sporulation protein YlmC with PRC-barrel domain
MHYPKLPDVEKSEERRAERKQAGDFHLRSAAKVTGYQIEATDGEIGRVEDFIIDDETWEVRYIVVDTRDWLPGKKVLVAPQWIERVSWEECKIYVNLSRQAIKRGPEYHADTLNREYEEKLYDHYDRPKYWDFPVGRRETSFEIVQTLGENSSTNQ